MATPVDPAALVEKTPVALMEKTLTHPPIAALIAEPRRLRSAAMDMGAVAMVCFVAYCLTTSAGPHAVLDGGAWFCCVLIGVSLIDPILAPVAPERHAFAKLHRLGALVAFLVFAPSWCWLLADLPAADAVVLDCAACAVPAWIYMRTQLDAASFADALRKLEADKDPRARESRAQGLMRAGTYSVVAAAATVCVWRASHLAGATNAPAQSLALGISMAWSTRVTIGFALSHTVAAILLLSGSSRDRRISAALELPACRANNQPRSRVD